MNIVHTQHSYKDVGSQLVLIPYTRTKQKDVSEGGSSSGVSLQFKLTVLKTRNVVHISPNLLHSLQMLETSNVSWCIKFCT